MRTKHYSEHVRHALRFYTRYPNLKEFRSKAAETDWRAAKSGLESVSNERTKKFLIDMYENRMPMSSNVELHADDLNVDVDRLWDIIYKFEKLVAEIRGLI